MSIFSKYFGDKKSENIQQEQNHLVQNDSEKKIDFLYNNYNNPDIPDVIELRNISQIYGENVIIKDLNFLAEKSCGNGSFKVILGPSGCGKSTLLRYIAGLQKPTSGEILLNENPRKDNDHVGMVFQKYSSFPWRTVKENVYYGIEVNNSKLDWLINQIRPILKKEKKKIISKSEMNKMAMEMIKNVGLLGHEDKYAQYPNLSGGQLQRVAIARSLLSTPDILLMDEPFGALDVPTRLQMQDMLLELYNSIKPTIILITHDIQEAVYLADDIYIMSHAPSKIVHHINVSSILPSDRKGIKRDSKFVKLVHDIEDLMMDVDNCKINQ